MPFGSLLLGRPFVIDDSTSAYIYGPGDRVIEQVTGSITTCVHQDQLGSTRLTTDSSGAVSGTYDYDAYGNTSAHTGSAIAPLQYAGQYLDVESGLYWMRARQYDPGTGQFISRDPLTATTGDPYAYASGVPLSSTDPSGMCSILHPNSRDGCATKAKEKAANLVNDVKTDSANIQHDVSSKWTEIKQTASQGETNVCFSAGVIVSFGYCANFTGAHFVGGRGTMSVGVGGGASAVFSGGHCSEESASISGFYGGGGSVGTDLHGHTQFGAGAGVGGWGGQYTGTRQGWADRFPALVSGASDLSDWFNR